MADPFETDTNFILIYDPKNKYEKFVFFKKESFGDGENQRKWWYHDPKHTDILDIIIMTESDAKKKFREKMKSSYVVVTGRSARSMYADDIHPHIRNNKADQRTGTSKPSKKPTPTKITTKRKPIKGQKGYSLIEKKKKGYCVPETKQRYWKKLRCQKLHPADSQKETTSQNQTSPLPH